MLQLAGGGEGGGGGGVIIFASILSLFLLHRKGNAQILSYSLEGRKNEST